MALYESFMVPCEKMERSRVPDGEGGWTTAWAEGAGFEAAIVMDSGAVAVLAEAQGATSLWTVTVPKGTALGFHDVFRRVSDGEVFRITKRNDPTPSAATFQFEQYQAQSWKLA